MDQMDGLRDLLFGPPATQQVQIFVPPKVRKTMCLKCPFGSNLDPQEQIKADALKARLRREPETIWGCHETIQKGQKPQVCAGFAKAQEED